MAVKVNLKLITYIYIKKTLLMIISNKILSFSAIGNNIQINSPVKSFLYLSRKFLLTTVTFSLLTEGFMFTFSVNIQIHHLCYTNRFEINYIYIILIHYTSNINSINSNNLKTPEKISFLGRES